MIAPFDNGSDLLFGLDDAPQCPESTTTWTPYPDLSLECLDLFLADSFPTAQHLLSITCVHLHGEIGAVEFLALSGRGVRIVRLEGMSLRRMMVISPPFMEMVGNVVTAGIRRGVFKVDDDVLAMDQRQRTGRLGLSDGRGLTRW